MRTAGLWLALAVAAGAQENPEPPPKVTAISPTLVQRGVPTEITITGERLAAVAALHFTGDGRIAFEFPSDRKAEAGKAVVRVTAAPDASLGERDLRAIGPHGASNPVSFVVGVLPVALEKEPNNKPDQAQKIDLPALVLGTVHASAEAVLFRLAARKGQRLVLNVQALRVGSKLDAALAVLDASGRELARDNDTFGLDPFLEFEVPADGEYLVAVRDALYRGAADYAYQLEAGEVPLVESIFPLGGRRGTSVEVAFSGRNLPPGARIRLDLAPDHPLGRRELRAETPFGPSNARAFEVGDLPEVEEAEGPEPQAVTVPVVVNGRIGTPGDADLFRFNAGENAQLVCEVTANRLGSPLDALLTLMDAKGRVIQNSDDASGNADARIDYNGFAKNGEYVLRVRDLVQRGGGAFAYRLRIAPPRPAEPNFALRFQPDAILVSRGSHARVWCEVARQGGFQGDLAVSFAELPKGVTCEPVTLPAKASANALFALSAAPDAPLGTFPVTLVARGRIGENEAAREGGPEMEARLVRQGFLTVLDRPLFTVDALGSPSEVDQRAKLAELAELERRLDASSPEFEASLAAWEKARTSPWTVVNSEREVTSTGGSYAHGQPDGSFLVQGKNAEKDTFQLEVKTSLKGITAFRLEALADDKFPSRGPGRAANGNFVLSEFRMKAIPASGGGERVVEFRRPVADFSQEGYSVEGAIDGNPETGWAVSPEFGKSHAAIFRTKEPLAFKGGAHLLVWLDHQSSNAQHVIGRFRLSVTTAAEPPKAPAHPVGIEAILDTPAGARTEAQKKDLSAYYRALAPELEELRRRIARIRGETAEFPPRAARDVAGGLGLVVRRREGWKGDVTVTLEGYTSGRDEKSKLPKAVAESLEFQPVILKEGQETAVIAFKPKPKCELGTRTVLLRAEGKVDKQTVVQYSRAIPLTVLEKMPEKPKPPPPKPKDDGLEFAFYTGAWDVLPDFDVLVPARTGVVADFDLAPRTQDDNFGFRFTGYLQVPKDGEYAFATVSDDGSKLAIGGTLVVNNNGLHAPEEKSGKIALKAGRHPILVAFFEREGGEHLEVFWEGPGIPKQKIPAAALFRKKE